MVGVASVRLRLLRMVPIVCGSVMLVLGAMVTVCVCVCMRACMHVCVWGGGREGENDQLTSLT